MKLLSKQRFAFSLIEVIVALAILTMAIGVMAQAVNNAMFASEVVQRNSEDEQFFRFALRQILQVEQRDDVDSGGVFELPEGGSMRWEAEIEETDIVDLFKLTIELEYTGDRWAAGAEDEQRSETLYLWRPAWSFSDERSALLEEKRSELQTGRTF